MALVKYGSGIVQMAGSIAGNVFARNRYGNYSRARTKPTNPNTTRQQVIRACIANLSTVWSLVLTAAQRDSWNLYGASVSMKNRLGENILLSGYNQFIRSNSLLLQHGQTLVLPGPTIFELPEKDSTFAISASEATQTISYTFDNTQLWANEVGGFMFKYMGSPQNAQRNYFGAPWRLHGLVAGAAIPPTSPDDQATPPFAFAQGQHVWCYARLMRADGRLSEPMRADCFCAA